MRRPGVIEVGMLDANVDKSVQTFFVKDNGVGIPIAHQSKLFRALQRCHPGVAPGEGNGSTFYVALPIVRF